MTKKAALTASGAEGLFLTAEANPSDPHLERLVVLYFNRPSVDRPLWMRQLQNVPSGAAPLTAEVMPFEDRYCILLLSQRSRVEG